MPQDSMQLALRNDEGHVVGELLVANLPGRQDTTFSARGDVALREAGPTATKYRPTQRMSNLEPRELFDPDDASWKRGRLRPGQAVGRLRIRVVDRTTELTGTTEVDVLAVKLDHETEYRQMLTDISSFAAEAVLQGFAPSMLDLAPSELTCRTAIPPLRDDRGVSAGSGVRGRNCACHLAATPHMGV